MKPLFWPVSHDLRKPRDLRNLKPLVPLVAPSLRLGCYSPGALGFLIYIDPLVTHKPSAPLVAQPGALRFISYADPLVSVFNSLHAEVILHIPV